MPAARGDQVLGEPDDLAPDRSRDQRRSLTSAKRLEMLWAWLLNELPRLRAEKAAASRSPDVRPCATSAVQHLLCSICCATSAVQHLLCNICCAASAVQHLLCNICCASCVHVGNDVLIQCTGAWPVRRCLAVQAWTAIKSSGWMVNALQHRACRCGASVSTTKRFDQKTRVFTALSAPL